MYVFLFSKDFFWKIVRWKGWKFIQYTVYIHSSNGISCQPQNICIRSKFSCYIYKTDKYLVCLIVLSFILGSPSTWRSWTCPTTSGRSWTSTLMPASALSVRRSVTSSSTAPTPSRTPSRGTSTETLYKQLKKTKLYTRSSTIALDYKPNIELSTNQRR